MVDCDATGCSFFSNAGIDCGEADDRVVDARSANSSGLLYFIVDAKE
jgi:hypothetical protein